MVNPRALNHPIAHEELINGQEVGVYRASAVGYCEWALLAARMGIDGAAPPEQMQKVFDEGYDNEARILEMFYEQNKYLTKFVPATPIHEVPIGDTILIRGHVDDLAQHAPGQVLLIEVKAVGGSLWDQWVKAIEGAGGDWTPGTTISDPVGATWPATGETVFAALDGLWQKYRDQVEVYMAAVNAESCAFVVGRKPERVEGEDARGLCKEIRWVWVKPNVARLARIKTKIAIVEARARGGVSLPKECPDQQYPCPYYYLLHPQKVKVEPITIEDDKLAAAMQDYMQAGVDEKNADKKKKAAKKILDRFFGQGEDVKLGVELAVSVGQTPDVTVIPAGQPVVSGEWIATYVERVQPAANYVRKAYTQKFYQVKKVGE